MDFVAVYAGDHMQEWDEYVSRHLAVSSEAVSAEHLWDPEVDSDYQRKYGVIQTPRLFLIAPDGTIIGRGLDAKALSYGLFVLALLPDLSVRVVPLPRLKARLAEYNPPAAAQRLSHPSSPPFEMFQFLSCRMVCPSVSYCCRG